MRFMLRLTIPIERGNDALKDPQFGSKMKQILTDMKAEAAYFTFVDGQRGGYIFVNMDDTSQLPGIAEPLFFWLNADMEFFPVMTPQDLEKGSAGIAAAVKKWA